MLSLDRLVSDGLRDSHVSGTQRGVSALPSDSGPGAGCGRSGLRRDGICMEGTTETSRRGAQSIWRPDASR